MKYVLPVLLAIAIAAAVFYKVKADNRDRDLEILTQNHAAAVDSTRLVYEDEVTGVREVARLASVRSQNEFQLVLDQFTSDRREAEGRISSLVRANALLRTQIANIPTVVTIDTVRSLDGDSTVVVNLAWEHFESHGGSSLDLAGETRYVPPDLATTEITRFSLELALALGVRERDDGLQEFFLLSDWPGLTAELDGAISPRTYYPKKSKWSYVTHGIAAAVGFVLGRL